MHNTKWIFPFNSTSSTNKLLLKTLLRNFKRETKKTQFADNSSSSKIKRCSFLKIQNRRWLELPKDNSINKNNTNKDIEDLDKGLNYPDIRYNTQKDFKPEKSESKNDIRIQSFNIQANSYIFPQKFKDHDSADIDWNNRKELIKNEIESANADIICLQEAEEEYFEIIHELNISKEVKNNNRKYRSIYAKKSGQLKKDGCAIIVDENKYEVVDHFKFDLFCIPKLKDRVLELIMDPKNTGLGSPLQLYIDFEDNKYKPAFVEGSLINRLDFRNVALFCIMKQKNTNKRFLVVNTHLNYNIIRGEVKFGQMILILKAIDYLMSKYSLKNVKFAGDFNFVPNSMLYHMLSTHHCLMDMPLNELSGQQLMKSDFVTKKPLCKQIRIADMKHEMFTSTNSKKESEYTTQSNRIKEKQQSSVKNYLQPSLLSELLATEVWDDPKHRRLGQKRVKNDIQNDTYDVNQNKKPSLIKLNQKQKVLDDHMFTFLSKLGLKSTYSHFYKQFHLKQDPQNPKKTGLDDIGFDRQLNNFDNSVTHITEDLKATVDYIWYNQNGDYEVNAILEMPRYSTQKKIKRNPSNIYGSDHFSLVTNFTLKNKL